MVGLRSSPLPSGEVLLNSVGASVGGITFFFPGIAGVVITADFPIARRVLGKEFDALEPFRAFPEIEMRHPQPHRPAVFPVQWRAGPAMREQGVLGGEI